MNRTKEPYSIVGYGVQGEFPDGCVAVYITGPNLPINGLPFITFADSPAKDIWARRWCTALNAAYDAGAGAMAKAVIEAKGGATQ